MRPANASLAALVSVAALLLAPSAGATGKQEKSSSSLENELESSLPHQQPEEQQLKAAAAAAAAVADATPKESRPKPKSQVHESGQRGQNHVTHGQQRQQQEKSSSQPPNRQEMREMFRQLLDSMTDTERQSLTLRLGQESVKRTFSRMKSQARALPVAIAPSPQKRASPRLPPARALRMRRSLLLGSMESGMASARQRRRKRDLVDYSPEEYAELAAMLADQPADYVEDADGNFRLPEDDEPADEPAVPVFDNGSVDELEPEQKRREFDYAEERGEDIDGSEDRMLGGPEDNGNDMEDRAAAEPSFLLPPLPPLPPPPPPPPPPLPQLAELEEQGQPPLTMFLVRMAGEKGLFVPLDQDRAEHLAEELAGEAAVAEAAETEAAAEAVAAEAQAEAAAEAAEAVEAAKRSQRQAAGVEELKRFAEKLARRVPPGY